MSAKIDYLRKNHRDRVTARGPLLPISVIKDQLRDIEEMHMKKRKRVIARLLPPEPAAPAAFSDFLARMKKIFGKKRMKVSGAEQLAAERERF